jgi:hypothetical protein
MKKYLFIILVIFSSCSEKVEDKKNNFVVAQDTVLVSYADSVEIALTKTKDIDVDIKQKIKEVEVLSIENKDLKVELKNTKDSLISTQEKLNVYTVKVPKKKSFFQKLIGSKTDSIEVQKVDTIKTINNE